MRPPLILELFFILGNVVSFIPGLQINDVQGLPNVPDGTTTPSSSVRPPPKREYSARHKLRSFLLKDYDKLVHPVTNHSGKVLVGVGMSLIHVDINELKSTMNVDAWMRFTWVDEYLTWSPETFDNLTQIHFSEDEIWKPDILPYNNANPESLNPYHKTSFLVEHTGEVLWVPPAHLKAFCRLDLKLWPQDSQTCSLKFGSWTSHANQIDLELFKNATVVEKLDFYTKDREWVVTNTSVVKNSVSYVDHPDIYADITFSFYMTRTSKSYKYIIILPCLVTMLMSTCSFGLPVDSPEKLLLNGLAFVVCVIYLIYFATILPFQSTTVPILVKFYSNTVVLIGIGIIINVVILNMTRVRKHVYPPKFLRIVFSGPLGKCLLLGHYRHQTSATHTRLQSAPNEMSDLTTEHDSSGGERLPNQNCTSNGGLPSSLCIDPEEDLIFSGNDIMDEWALVAAGVEKICLFVYVVSFSIGTYSYS